MTRPELNDLALFWSAPVWIEGERFLVLVPKADWRSARFDHTEFDRAVCAAGLKGFVRPTTPSDNPNPLEALGLVRRVGRRRGVALTAGLGVARSLPAR